MEVAELQGKIREVYKLINYQNVEFEWNEKLRQARKILNEIQSELNQPTVSCRVCFSPDCFYHDKTTDTCVGDYAKCTIKQTHR